MTDHYHGPYINHPRFDVLKARLAKIKTTHDNTTSGDYAKQQRTFARKLCTEAGLNPEQATEVAPWAALRPPGRLSWDDQNDRSWAVLQETRAREEAHQKAMNDFNMEEENYRNTVEYAMQRWHEQHGAAFMAYLNDEPCFNTLALWDGLRRLALAWSTAAPLTKYHSTHPLPCPLPPACGRGAFLASLPPGTPDHGKTHPGPGYTGGRQVLQDDLTI